jgi:hypothetical protein
MSNWVIVSTRDRGSSQKALTEETYLHSYFLVKGLGRTLGAGSLVLATE